MRKRERRIDTSNVFSLNRLSLNDTVEGGASLTYGTEFSKENKRNQEVLISSLQIFLDLRKQNSFRNKFMVKKHQIYLVV